MGTVNPLLVRGPLSDRVYVVTRYRVTGGGAVEALTKYDVTDQFRALVADEGRSER